MGGVHTLLLIWEAKTFIWEKKRNSLLSQMGDLFHTEHSLYSKAGLFSKEPNPVLDFHMGKEQKQFAVLLIKVLKLLGKSLKKCKMGLNSSLTQLVFIEHQFFCF